MLYAAGCAEVVGSASRSQHQLVIGQAARGENLRPIDDERRQKDLLRCAVDGHHFAHLETEATLLSLNQIGGLVGAGVGRSGRDRMEHGLPDMGRLTRSEEHTSELQSLMRISYAVFCLKKTRSITKNN